MSQLELATTTGVCSFESAAAWPVLRGMPVRIAVYIALPSFSMGQLHALRPGQLLLSASSAAGDVAVRAGGAMVGWAEFDSIDGRMAVRLTRLVAV